MPRTWRCFVTTPAPTPSRPDPSTSFTRDVLMHISPSVELQQRIVTWLAPGGWLLLEEPDFGMWMADADQLWATAPQTTQAAFP